MKTQTRNRTVDTDARLIRNANLETQYSAADFMNPDAWDRSGKCGNAFVFLNGGGCIGILFPDYYQYSESDALDELADSGRLDAFQVTEDELKDYETGERTDVGSEHCPEGYPEYDGRITTLGNASEYFDIEALDIWRVPMAEFEEEVTLMTAARVLDRLESMLADAEAEYSRISVDHPDWNKYYLLTDDLKDANTLARLQSRK